MNLTADRPGEVKSSQIAMSR